MNDIAFSPDVSPPPGRVVLVVEDEPILRASMARGLSKLHDVEVIDAGSLADARKLLEAYHPALVVSDLDLPDGSGIELAPELDRHALRIPLLFVSAFVRDYRGRLPKRPEVEVFEKPVPLERLRGLVEERLARTKQASSPFGVADYVQLAGMGRRSVAIEVHGRVAGRGIIVIRGGEVWSARDERGGGIDAFRRLAFLRDAAVRCRSLEPGEALDRDVEGQCDSVLLDAARWFDEACHEAGTDQPRDLDAPADALDAGWEAAPPSSAPAIDPAERRERFAVAYERAVDALLAKKHADAFGLFVEASRLDPHDARVAANLRRLRELGYGG